MNKILWYHVLVIILLLMIMVTVLFFYQKNVYDLSLDSNELSEEIQAVVNESFETKENVKVIQSEPIGESYSAVTAFQVNDDLVGYSILKKSFNQKYKISETYIEEEPAPLQVKLIETTSGMYEIVVGNNVNKKVHTIELQVYEYNEKKEKNVYSRYTNTLIIPNEEVFVLSKKVIKDESLSFFKGKNGAKLMVSYECRDEYGNIVEIEN